jgi:hypothetical protein
MQLSYNRWMAPLSTAVGIGPKKSIVDIDGPNLRVKMGWAFDATIPLSQIIEAKPGTDRIIAFGVHLGTGGRWLVNGSATGLVDLTIEPGVKAKAIGMPITLKRLMVSVDDPDALIAACPRA